MAKKGKLTLLGLFILAFSLGEVARVAFNEITVGLLDIAVGLTVVTWVVLNRKIPKSRLIKPLGIFLVILSFSLITNANRLNSIELLISSLYLFRWFFYAVFYFIVAGLSYFKGKVEKAMLIGGGIVVAAGFIQYLFYPDLRNLFYLGWDEHLYRMFTFTFLDPNFAGVFFVMFFLFAVDKLWAKESNAIKIILLGTFIALILTFSRSAYVAFIIGLTFLSILNKKKLFGLLAIVSFIISIYTASILVLKSEGTNILRTASGEARLASMKNAIVIIRDYPVFGVGFNSYRYIQRDYGFVDESKALVHSAAGTDNSFLFILATSGIMGFIAFLYLWYKILKNRRPLVLSSILALFVSSLFVNSLFFPPIMLWIWAVIALKENN